MTEEPKRSSKGGRPTYRPSLEDRKTVEEMKFVGEGDNTIARALGIDPDTLTASLSTQPRPAGSM